MGIKIREADVQDINDIFSLLLDFAASFTPNMKDFTNSYNEIITNNDAILLVAEYNDHIIGYAYGFDHYTFYANGRVSWLEEIMVDEKYRRQKAGTLLLKHFEQWARGRHSKLIALATRRAASFYKALDFDESAVYFRKKL